MKHRRRRRGRLKQLSVAKLIPNMLTTLAMCAGLTGIQFGLQQNWQAGVVAVAIAAILDSLDGGVARFLNAGSEFGAELDSLADLVSFGVAPAVLLYMWCMGEGGSIGAALVVLYTVCCALRLARFNVRLDDADRPPWAARFFTGVPTPAGAGMVLLPMMLSFQLGDGIFASEWLNGAMLLGVSMLMVSRVPSFSLKQTRVPHKMVLPMLLAVVMLAFFVVTRPWITLSAIVLAYIASLPFAYRRYRALQRQPADAAPPEDPDDEAGMEELIPMPGVDRP